MKIINLIFVFVDTYYFASYLHKKYAVQITVADVRDGACSSSTLKEACSWGKVDTTFEQMIYAEATTVVPIITSYVYHKGTWKNTKQRNFNLFLDKAAKK